MVAQAYSANNQEARQEDQEFDHPWLQSNSSPLPGLRENVSQKYSKEGAEGARRQQPPQMPQQFLFKLWESPGWSKARA